MGQYVRESLELGRKNVEAWGARKLADAENTWSLCRSMNNEWKGKIAELKEQLETLNEEIVYSQRVNDNEQERLEVMQQSLLVTDERSEALRESIQELMDRRKCHEQIILNELAEIGATFSDRKRRLEAQQEAISWCEKILGFRVEHSSALKIVFTKLDPCNLDREFSFSIRHDKHTDLYTMLNCDPYVECSRDLLDELNRSNKLYTFIRSMRSQFQAILQK